MAIREVDNGKYTTRDEDRADQYELTPEQQATHKAMVKLTEEFSERMMAMCQPVRFVVNVSVQIGLLDTPTPRSPGNQFRWN